MSAALLDDRNDARPLLNIDTHDRRLPYANYASTSSSSRSPLSRGASHDDVLRANTLVRVLEEEDEEDGGGDVYRGSYRRSIAMFCFVPLSTILLFIFLAAGPYVCLPRRGSPAPQPTVPFLPYPLPELLLAVSFWSLSYTIRLPLHVAISTILPSSRPRVIAVVFAFLLSLLITFLRLAALPLLGWSERHPSAHHTAFRSIWWFALGWGGADLILAICQGFETLGLYKNVVFTSEEEEIGLSGKQQPADAAMRCACSPTAREPTQPFPTALVPSPIDAVADVLEHDLDELIALKGRDEVEDIYGMPFPQIPVFVSSLLRIVSLLATLAFTLLLSAAFLRSTAVTVPSPSTTSVHLSSSFYPALSSPRSRDLDPESLPMLITVPCVLIAHTVLTVISSPPFLAHVGVHTAAYVGLLVALGALFAGLGMWGVVV